MSLAGHKINYLHLLLLTCFLTSTCDKKSSENSPSSEPSATPGNINVRIQDSTAELRARGLTATSCDCSEPGTSGGGPLCDSRPDGKCFTPSALKGFINSVSIAGINSADNLHSRLMGGGDKYHGLEAVFRTGFFDASKPIFFDGDDNIQDQGGKYNSIGISFQSIEYQFAAAGKYMNVRIPVVTIPAMNDAAFQGCIDEGGLGESQKYIQFLSAPAAITAGDILVCVKDQATDVCQDSDFQWVDAAGILYTSRPETPLRLKGDYAFNASNCTAGSDHPSATWGSLDLIATTDEDFTITAQIDAGKKIYSYANETGTTLDATITLDLSNQLYVPNAYAAAFTSTDYATDGATILGHLDQITLRQIYQYNTRKSSTTNIDSDNFIQASFSAVLSEKSEEEDGDVEDLSTTFPESP